MKMPSTKGARYNGIVWETFNGPPAPSAGIEAKGSFACLYTTDPSLMTVVYWATNGLLYSSYYESSGTWAPATPIIDDQDPVPNAVPAIAWDGTHTYVVYASGARLYCIIDGGTPSDMGNDGISETTSPALFAYNDILYCVYQSYNSGGELQCMCSTDSGKTWSQINPPGGGYYGLSGSPSVAVTEDGSLGYVMYQGYGASGCLSGSLITAGNDEELGLQKFVNNFQGFGLPVPYMSGSPSVTVRASGAVCVVMADTGGDILVFTSTAPWLLESPGELAAGTSPALVTFDGFMVCFWLADD
jgi:hypothetical protein